MKEFIEKLIGRLKYKLGDVNFEKDTQEVNESYFDGLAYAYGDVINTINQLAEEYKNGWIPCSSGNFSTSEVLVCKEDGTIDFDVFDFMDEDWKFNSKHHKNKVIAWMPLPQPYIEQQKELSTTWQQQTMRKFERVE